MRRCRTREATPKVRRPTCVPPRATHRCLGCPEGMAPTGGHIAEVDGFEIGLAAMALGAGRQAADAAIDPHVGIRLLKKEGDAVASGEPIAEVIAKDDTAAVSVQARMLRAVHIVSQPITHKRPLLGRRFEV